MVSEKDLDSTLDLVRADAAGSVAGIFGPESLTWKIDREAVIFLGAGRALLLQLAHPWVAAAIAEHSRTFADPIGRFHRTFDIVFAMVFGSLDRAFASARQLHRRHTMIVGHMPEAAGPFAAGSRYCANDVAALRWVHATLVDTALIVHDLVLPPFSVEEREQYWAESRLFGTLYHHENLCRHLQQWSNPLGSCAGLYDILAFMKLIPHFRCGSSANLSIFGPVDQQSAHLYSHPTSASIPCDRANLLWKALYKEGEASPTAAR